MVDHVVYYSSPSENTKRFVERLGLPSTRIPLKKSDPMPLVEQKYVLIIPTYGGGASMMGRDSHPVLPQIYRFLEIAENKNNLTAVIASGNINFGEDYCAAGKVISTEFGVPYVYRFELSGTEDDIRTVRQGVKTL